MRPFIKYINRYYVFTNTNSLFQNTICTTNIIVKKNINFSSKFESQKSERKNYKLYTAFCAFIGCGTYFYISDKKILLQHVNSKKNANFYPFYTLSEIAKHSSKEDRIWVTYKQGVYDITDFVDNHPGGDVIMMAAGNAVDPFWLTYGAHKQAHILEILEQYRIGNISKEDSQEAVRDLNDPYSNEPTRNPELIINAEKPFNAEPPPLLLIQNFITPSNNFYVRNHLPVPDIDIDEYELEIVGLGVNETKLSLNDLITKFPKISVTATIQCAGNRRNEMTQIKPVKGLNWGAGAIGNAVWSGARLSDVLNYCGFKFTGEIRHIHFEGLDTDPTNVPYAASIPIEKFLIPYSDIILAYEMNGEPLPRDHGYPLRAIVPGIVGARNVKWLGRVILSDKESSSHWQQNDYKGFCPNVDWDTVDFKSSVAIQELPVISAICDPINGQKVKLQDGKLIVKGYAFSGGGCKIVRVDITADKGNSWQAAEIVEQDNTNSGRCWSWVLWKAEIPIQDSSVTEVEIWSKAVDSHYNVQPESFANIWNLRGVLSNAYHRVKIYV